MGKTMKKWKTAVMLTFCLVLTFVSRKNTFAEEFVSEKNGLDVIFVMDYSGSMKTNDSQYIAQSMVKAFVDTVHSANIRIGFVAYNDHLLSSTSPLSVSTNEERQSLKQLIDSVGYSGNTDIGLGLRNAYDLISQEQDRKKVIILISDGESDLTGSETGRVLENSLQDVEYVAKACEEQKIPIYSIAFGKYDGNTAALENLSNRTGAEMYAVRRPEALIEILYGIFADNMDYSIQEIANGVYAQGLQNILLKLDEAYLDELDVLMISPQVIGQTNVLYGENPVEVVNLKNYAVAKIIDVDSEIRELTVQTETAKNQELQIYLISYRDLTPVLNVKTENDKNIPLEYEVYFKDKSGNRIIDESFYKRFACELTLNKSEQSENPLEVLDTDVRNGIISGQTVLKSSGNYYLEGRLDDNLGTAIFKPAQIAVANRLPSGELPENVKFTILSKDKHYVLDDYFSDQDGDHLEYSLKPQDALYAETQIDNGVIAIKPIKSGSQTVTVLVSDGEGVLEYPYNLTVMPLWKAYWWVILIFLAALAGILWKLLYKPKPVLEQIAEEKKSNRFCGKLDLYFTKQPESDEEMPPLSFQMHKIKDSKVTLGNLLREYQEASDALGLDDIYLIADEDRRMVLYHTSDALVMLGNSIVCRQIQYSVSFGDVIYITSQDGAYDMEVHYIAMIQ